MGERLDELLGDLASQTGDAAPGDFEAGVWRRVDTRAAATGRLTSGMAVQGLIAACALLIGFSVQAYRQGQNPAPPQPRPSLTLLDGSTVAEAGNFQVLR